MGTQPRKHHIVPRSYLKFFTEKRKDEYVIQVYDKLTKKFYSANIKNVAAERDYYRDNTFRDSFYWEKYFSDTYECKIPQNIAQIITPCLLATDKSEVLNKKVKEALCPIIQTYCFERLLCINIFLKSQITNSKEI